MKKTTQAMLLASAIFCAGNLSAVQVEWTEDTVNAFNFTMTGSGLPYDRTETNASMSLQYYGIENQRTMSPSGIWEMSVSLYGVIAGAPDLSEIWNINIGRITSVWRNLQYGDEVMGLLYGSISTPFRLTSFVDGLYEAEGTYTPGFDGWSPCMKTIFTYSDYWNPLTWEWAINSTGRSPVSSASVPESGSTMLLLASALGMIGLCRYRLVLKN